MKTPILKRLMTAGLLVFSLAAAAEDIDLFAIPPREDIPKPNVLIIVDNTANWNQAFSAEMKALADTIASLPTGADGAAAFRIGILFSAETGSGNNSVAGGYVRAAIRSMNSNNKGLYSNLINSLDKEADKGNGGQASLVMAEAYRYLSGGVPYAGNFKAKTDYKNNTSGTPASKAVYALVGSDTGWDGNALASKDATPYNKPSSNCQKNFIIYISNGAPQDNSTVISKANAMLAEAGGATTTIPVSPSGSQDNVSDEWARFMKKTALGVTTFTIDVDKVTTGQGPGWSALLKSMANVSAGKYFDVSTKDGNTGDAIQAALNSALSEIQSVNSVFASVSLPVSVNTQGTYLNQVFIGLFRPSILPKWPGNLKQYKLGYDSTGSLSTLDADNADAISSGGTGFIAECARSFWTPKLADDYWKDSPMGSCLSIANSDKSNTPDGNIVEKGGQAYMLRGAAAYVSAKAADRKVYTCSPTQASCTTLTSFDTANTAITQPLLDPTEAATNRDTLIGWARGENPKTELGMSHPIRPLVHGDVVHSRPVAIDFGADAGGVVVFYGANDGMLRAIKGNRDKGEELWAFMAPEFYPHIKRIYDNTPLIKFKETSPPAEPKRYGFDGAITAYKNADSTWLYGTLRRGGRSIYAFDVTNPAVPTLKWKRGCPNNFKDDGSVNDDGCNDGFAGIGQTWAAPKPLKAQGYSAGGAGTEKPMLIMAGGYDPCEDGDPATNGCALTKGNKIYILDADTGTLLKTLNTDRAVVADMFVVNNSSNGMAEWAYTADMGGNVYRISGVDANTPFKNTPPANWTITKIASLGGSGADARKFIFTPDIVRDNDQYILLLGSGDREKPLSSYTGAMSVANKFFMLKDDPGNADWLTSETANCGTAVICMNSLESIANDGASPTLATVQGKKGWALAMRPGEQVVTSAITIFGTVTFHTHEPAPKITDPNVCSPGLGTARVYNISYANATNMNGTESRGRAVAGGGLPPSPVAGMVTLDNGETVPFCIGCDPASPLRGTDPPPPVMANQPKSRVYWYIQQ
ncbi:MAG: pilus assembly protein [Thiobacillus sp.]